MQYQNWLFGKDGALFHASATGNLHSVEILVSMGANVNAQSVNGYTPLHRAAQNGHKAVVEHLLIHKANANAKSVTNETPLSLAEKNKHSDIAALLSRHIQI